MISISDLIKMLKIENKVIHDQTNGLSHLDTLLQPQPTGNCMNWVLGHLLDTQIVLLGVLGGVSPIDPNHLERYTRESDPIRMDGVDVLNLGQLLAGNDQIHDALCTRLGEMTDADFEEDIQLGERTVNRGWRVFFLHFHFTYHIGQLELLRQLAGFSDKII